MAVVIRVRFEMGRGFLPQALARGRCGGISVFKAKRNVEEARGAAS
jgi:hypothetical protein